MELQNVTLYKFGQFETVLGLVALMETLYIIKNLEISGFPQPKIEEKKFLALSEDRLPWSSPSLAADRQQHRWQERAKEQGQMKKKRR